MKKTIIILIIFLISSLALNGYLFFEKSNFDKNLDKKNNFIKQYFSKNEENKKIILEKDEKIKKLEKDLQAKILYPEKLTDENFFDAIISYNLTPRDRCMLPVFGHQAFSYFANNEASFYDLLTLFKISCIDEEKSTLEFILMEPIENTKGKIWQDYFEHGEQSKSTHYLGKEAILKGSLDYLKKHKDYYSKENILELKKVFEKSRSLVENEIPEIKDIYKQLFEILNQKN